MKRKVRIFFFFAVGPGILVDFAGVSLAPSYARASKRYASSSRLGEVAPESFATGAGTELAPFTSRDGLAGFGQALSILSSARGGVAVVGAARYDVTNTSGIPLNSAGLGIVGRIPGFNVDPNGEAEGVNGGKIRCSGTCITFNAAGSAKLGGLVAQNLYLWSAAGKSARYYGLYFPNPTDQPNADRVNVSNFGYGIYVAVAGIVDAGNFTRLSLLNNTYGLFFADGSIYAYSKVIACEVSDNDSVGIYVGTSSYPWLRLVGNTVVRNARMMGDANIVLRGGGVVLGDNVIRDAGHNQNAGTYRAADCVLVQSNHNVIVGNWISDCTRGAAVHVSGNNNQVIANHFSGNSVDVLLDSGTRDNLVVVPNGTNVVDNGPSNRIVHQ